ncbi:MAG: hypothetical protein K2N00_01005 [Lachnospiraceae bacterium]|nr:hypothetical protein [Lachnospiraceae bacterium]
MNLSEFRIAHSIVMEHFQFIEMHLEGIYAALSGRSFYEGLKDTREAGQMRNLLFEKKIKLMEIIRDNHAF